MVLHQRDEVSSSPWGNLSTYHIAARSAVIHISLEAVAARFLLLADRVGAQANVIQNRRNERVAEDAGVEHGQEFQLRLCHADEAVDRNDARLNKVHAESLGEYYSRGVAAHCFLDLRYEGIGECPTRQLVGQVFREIVGERLPRGCQCSFDKLVMRGITGSWGVECRREALLQALDCMSETGRGMALCEQAADEHKDNPGSCESDVLPRTCVAGVCCDRSGIGLV